MDGGGRWSGGTGSGGPHPISQGGSGASETQVWFYHSTHPSPAALRIRCTPYPAFQGRSMQGAFTERSGEKSVWKTDETCVSSSGSGSPPGLTSSRTLEKKCQESCPPPCPRGAGHTPAWTHVVAEVLSFPAQWFILQRARGYVHPCQWGSRLPAQASRGRRRECASPSQARLPAAGKHMFIQTLPQGGLSLHSASACP